MSKKAITIDREILNRFPEVAIGYVVVDNLHHIAAAKISSEIRSLSMKGIMENQLGLQNLVDFPTISAWRNVYQSCAVKPKTFKSSIESLLRRFIQRDYKEIIPIVDLYNFFSAGFVLPIGGYDFNNIDSTLMLRRGREGDRFIPLNGKEDIVVNSQHIVYADENTDEPIICWMWNHKDCKRTMLTNQVTKGLFIFDCIRSEDQRRLNEAQEEFAKYLSILGGTIVSKGTLNIENPTVNF